MHKRVILAVPWSREILAGIAQYLQTHERWWINSVPHWATYIDPDQWRQWDGDGIIIQQASRQPLDVMLQHSTPAVSVSDDGWNDLLPSVHLDNHAIGRLGADYFLRRGFRHLMFAGELRPCVVAAAVGGVRKPSQGGQRVRAIVSASEGVVDRARTGVAAVVLGRFQACGRHGGL